MEIRLMPTNTYRRLIFINCGLNYSNRIIYVERASKECLHRSIQSCDCGQ